MQFTFCLNILLLGFGAAFFGNFVERHIKMSALLSTVLLSMGFAFTWGGLHFKHLLLVYFGAGILCGIAQGIAYVISPKNLLLWWNKTKYKATVMSLSIICFGLGSSMCSVLFKYFNSRFGIEDTMLWLCGIYMTMMLIGTALVNKPKFALKKIKTQKKFDYVKTLDNSMFWRLWTFMFLNITAGLILIGNCASMLKHVDLAESTVVGVMFICGLSNGFGRLVFPFMTDFMKRKQFICILILGLEICLVFPALVIPIAIPMMLILINATYGSAFAVLPTLVSSSFGNSYLTTIHGLVLSAWGVASAAAYFCTSFFGYTGESGTTLMLIIILITYVVNFANCTCMIKKSS